MNMPLVTMCVMCHNQVEYIGLALRSALIQTYHPLEIVVVDDASTDGSWELINKLVDEYNRNEDADRHDVKVYHNLECKGMLGNRQYCYTLSHGELVVNCDGDDVSFPNRVQALVAAWNRDGKRATILTSKAIIVDDRLNPMGILDLGEKPIGALLAVAASVTRKFSTVEQDAAYHAHDDLVFDLRARLFGHRLFVDQPLALYRYGSGFSSGGDYRKKMVRGFTGIIAGMKQYDADLEVAKDDVTPSVYENGKQAVVSQIESASNALKLWRGKVFSERLLGYRLCGYGKMRLKEKVVGLLLLLPPVIGDAILACLSGVQHMKMRVKSRNINLNDFCVEDVLRSWRAEVGEG